MTNSQVSRGVTLLEVLVALALSSLMLVAITGVLKGLMMQKRELVQSTPKSWQFSLNRLLWNDIAQARLIALEPGRFSIWSGSGKEIQYTWSPVTATSEQPLVRTIIDVDEKPTIGKARNGKGSQVAMSSQTVLWGVSTVEFERMDSSGSPQPIPSTYSPAPSAIQYRIGTAGTILTQVILVR